MNTPMDFDTTVRAHHRKALVQLSPRMQAQLAQRRNAALRGERPAAHQHRLRYAAAGFAAVGALMLGLQFQTPAPQGSAPVATIAALPLTASPATSGNTGSNLVLEQDPDFYAWLGSSDAPQLAME